MGLVWRSFHALKYLIQGLACKYDRLSTALDTVLTVSFIKRNAVVKAFMKYLNLNPDHSVCLSLANQGATIKV